jgi:hypothetical protein
MAGDEVQDTPGNEMKIVTHNVNERHELLKNESFLSRAIALRLELLQCAAL